ncbi:NXPE family member 1-like [Pelodytes ibericus]
MSKNLKFGGSYKIICAAPKPVEECKLESFSLYKNRSLIKTYSSSGKSRATFSISGSDVADYRCSYVLKVRETPHQKFKSPMSDPLSLSAGTSPHFQQDMDYTKMNVIRLAISGILLAHVVVRQAAEQRSVSESLKNPVVERAVKNDLNGGGQQFYDPRQDGFVPIDEESEILQEGRAPGQMAAEGGNVPRKDQEIVQVNDHPHPLVLPGAITMWKEGGLVSWKDDLEVLKPQDPWKGPLFLLAPPKTLELKTLLRLVCALSMAVKVDTKEPSSLTKLSPKSCRGTESLHQTDKKESQSLRSSLAPATWPTYSNSFVTVFQTCEGTQFETTLSKKEETTSEVQIRINEIFKKIEQIVPKVNFSDFQSTTSGKHSKASIAHPRDKYCIGEDFVVELELYDHLGVRKPYGGDFIRARMFSPEIGAAMSGRVEDLNNGTYHVHYSLYWDGRVKISIMLFHPSEGISALWRARHSSLGVISFQGRFVYQSQEAFTMCGFKLNTDQEICDYLDAGDEEAFYCIKPPNLPCDCLTDMRAVDPHVTFLTNLENKMFERSNIAVEIPKNFEFIDVNNCSSESYFILQGTLCVTGMGKIEVWGGRQDFTRILQRTKSNMIGDSTLRQFIMHFTEGIKMANYFGYHGKQWSNWEKTLLALNMEKDIYISYKRHGFPLESFMFYYFKEDKYTSRQIDQNSGGKDIIIVITMGQHFRQFPLQLYIRRAINIRRAIERLFLRSPDTKVIIKTENTRDIHPMVERIGDFHGYTQYLVLREVFYGINVGFVDAWDMTIASATESVHPPGNVLNSIMSMTFTFAC